MSGTGAACALVHLELMVVSCRVVSCRVVSCRVRSGNSFRDDVHFIVFPGSITCDTLT